MCCKAMNKADFEYHLHHDCYAFCICSLTNNRCIAIDVGDPDDASSRFVHRSQNIFNNEKAKQCPCFGISDDLMFALIEDKMKRQLEETKRRIYDKD